jgi:hypothetical protein
MERIRGEWRGLSAQSIAPTEESVVCKLKIVHCPPPERVCQQSKHPRTPTIYCRAGNINEAEFMEALHGGSASRKFYGHVHRGTWLTQNKQIVTDGYAQNFYANSFSR